MIAREPIPPRKNWSNQSGIKAVIAYSMTLANVLCHRAVPGSHTGDIPDFDPGFPALAPHQLGEPKCCFVLAQLTGCAFLV